MGNLFSRIAISLFYKLIYCRPKWVGYKVVFSMHPREVCSSIFGNNDEISSFCRFLSEIMFLLQRLGQAFHEVISAVYILGES